MVVWVHVFWRMNKKVSSLFQEYGLRAHLPILPGKDAHIHLQSDISTFLCKQEDQEVTY